ncbi:MAG TPA: protease SohB [Spongiibacteraceae bacterium]|jgi:serine protease SohB|nr:protease SohB [Spongiibacteraceae bacterium]HUH37688.1 protease SohB [Spongiibacteraceae bacterium]
MLEFLYEYGLFLAKAVTLVVALVFVISMIAAVSMRRGRTQDEHIDVENINEKFEDLEETLKAAVLDASALKADRKAVKRRHKEEERKRRKGEHAHKTRLYVLGFEGDIQASAVDDLREEITAILTLGEPGDEVLVVLESTGGLVHSYGLAAAQLQRIRDHGLGLTVAVDQVAASGGYMMACIANHIIAAPFAVIGSIGVIAQLPNFHKLLKKHDVDIELHTAGEYKRTLTVFGENTEPARRKFQEELNETHLLFKAHVAEHRPALNIEEIATGEVWYGSRALDKRLVDELITSDDYLLKRRHSHDIYRVKRVVRKSLQEKLGVQIGVGIERLINRCWQRLTDKPLP